MKKTDFVFSFLISSCIHKEKNQYNSALKDGEDRLQFGCLNAYVEKMFSIFLHSIENMIQELKKKKEQHYSFSYDSKVSNSENKVYYLLLESSLLSPYGITNNELMKEASISKRTLMYILKELKSQDKLVDTEFGRFTYHKLRRY